MGDAMDALEALGAKYGMGQYRYPSNLTHIVNPIRAPRRKGASRQDPKNIFAAPPKSNRLTGVGLKIFLPNSIRLEELDEFWLHLIAILNCEIAVLDGQLIITESIIRYSEIVMGSGIIWF